VAGVPRQLAASATAASVATIAAVAVAALLAPGAAAAGLTTDDVLGRSVAECSTIRAFHPDDVYAYLCFYSAAVAGEFEAARAALDAVLDADPAEPRAALYAGLLAVAANEDRAEPLLRVSAAGFEREADARGEVWARISLGWNLYHRGRPAEGQAEIERALAVARASAEPMLVAEAEVSVGWLHQNAWRHSDAFAAFRSAARVLLPDGPAHLRVRLLDGLGATAWALGRYEDALEYYRQHLATIGLADPAGEALVLANMTLVARRLAIEGRLSEDERLDYERRTLDAALRAVEGVDELERLPYPPAQF